MINVKPHSCVEQQIVSDLIVCGASYHTRAVLLCGPTNKLDLIHFPVPLTHVVFLLYCFYKDKWGAAIGGKM